MRNFKENVLSLAHLPTWMLVIGFPIYWLEMFFHQQNYGITTPLAWISFSVIAGLAVVRACRSFDGKKFYASLDDGQMQRMMIWVGVGLCLVIVVVGLYASLLPPHLVQEEDVLNYHYTFPRQHLLRNSFEHISWSTFDLLPYPIQSALAPFWFATQLPNKFPQFLFFIAVPFLAIRLLTRLGSNDLLKKILMVFAIFGAHHVGIQTGTAMLDIVLVYLFLAALDSILSGHWILAAIEFVFYFWAKSFIPLQMILLAGALFICLLILKRLGFQISLGFSLQPLSTMRIDKIVFRKFLILFCVLSVAVAGPFVWKSFYVTGSPLFPFFVGTFSPSRHVLNSPWEWEVLKQSADYYLSMKDAYGLPRTALNFLQHFWLLGVPQQGVNNVFDYPLGLVYLLCIGPFLWLVSKKLLQKSIGIIPLFVVLMWMSWWFGSQQSRFLSVPLFLMYILVIAEIQCVRGFFITILLALCSTTGSVFRAHRTDFCKSPVALLRTQDKIILEMNERFLADDSKAIRIINYHQAAFAQFPVRVIKEKIPYVIPVKSDEENLTRILH